MKQIVFQLPENTYLFEMIDEILKKNNLEQTPKDFFSPSNAESRSHIIKDSAIILYQKKVPEDKLADFLEKHLKTSKENVKKVIIDIKEKLVPYIKVIDVIEEKEEEKREFQKPLPPPQPEVLPPGVKKVDIKDVEENAEQLKREGRRGPDVYKEPIE